MHQYFLMLLAAWMAFTSQSYAAAAMTEAQFQDYTYQFLVKNYKERKIVKASDPLLIKMDEYELGLQNVYNMYKQDNLSSADLDALLKEHFVGVITQLEQAGKFDIKKWASVKGLVRPQIAPREYLARVALVHETLDDHAIVTYVLDADKGYQYIREDDLATWGVSRSTLHETAMNNLDSASHKIPMRGSLAKDKFIAIAAGDGYDAARMLVPSLRKFIASKLGSPYYAAIPNRDFLIMWSTQNSAQFQKVTTERVKADYKSQPYPLSPDIFLVSEKSIRVVK